MADTPKFTIRLNDLDRRKLAEITQAEQLDSEADAIRWLIRRYGQPQAAPPPATIVQEAAPGGPKGF